MSSAVYLDTSVVLRVVLEAGTTPELELRLRSAPAFVTSRLSQIEAARALLRLRHENRVPVQRLAGASREIDALWARCDLLELTESVCELAGRIAPMQPLRTLDAIHLATFVIARREIEDLELLTADERLSAAARLV